MDSSDTMLGIIVGCLVISIGQSVIILSAINIAHHNKFLFISAGFLLIAIGARIIRKELKGI